MQWNKHFTVCILVATWTFIQTLLQLTWAILGYYFYFCQIRPTHYDSVLLYLTYFYNSKCGELELVSNNETFISNLFQGTPATAVYEVQEVITAVLERASLPQEANAADRMNVYLHLLIIYNSIWGLSAIAMFVGAFCKVTKTWSIVCIGPWLISTAYAVLFDVVSAVHFGLDIRLIYNYSSWLRFIGVSNYKDFTEFDTLEYAKFLPTLPSTLMCSLFSRFLIVWVLNVLCFFSILHTVALLQQGSHLERPTEVRPHSRRGRVERRQDELNSSEARIRNWQQFYGAVGTNNTVTSTSSSDDRDYNSNNSTFSSTKQDQANAACFFQKDPKSLQEITQNHKQPIPTTTSSSSLYFRRYSDVADGITGHLQDVQADPGGNQTNKIVPSVSKMPPPVLLNGGGTLRNQLPWSYFSTQEPVLGQTGGQNYYNNYGRPKNTLKVRIQNREMSTEM